MTSSIKFNFRRAGQNDDEDKVCYQLFVPKMCINTQYQTWSSLENSSRHMLDTILRYADFNEHLCEVCVQKEVSVGRRLHPDEIDTVRTHVIDR